MSIFLHSESTIINHSNHLLSSKYYSNTLQTLAISFYFVITYYIHYHSYDIRSQNIMICTLRLPLSTPSLHMFPPSSFPCTTRHPTSHLIHPQSLTCGFTMRTEPLLQLNDQWILIGPYPWITLFSYDIPLLFPFIFHISFWSSFITHLYSHSWYDFIPFLQASIWFLFIYFPSYGYFITALHYTSISSHFIYFHSDSLHDYTDYSPFLYPPHFIFGCSILFSFSI